MKSRMKRDLLRARKERGDAIWERNKIRSQIKVLAELSEERTFPCTVRDTGTLAAWIAKNLRRILEPEGE